MAFVRLHLKGFPGSLLRAIAVLEHLLIHSPRHWGAIVILILLYIHVGSPSLAAEMYARLDVKNLQHSTLSWILVTRISTIRPNSQGSSTKSKPGTQTVNQLELIMRALDWHSQQQESQKSELMDMIHRDKFANSINALHCNGQIFTGFNKYLLLVELCRIQRLSRSPLSPRYEEMLSKLALLWHRHLYLIFRDFQNTFRNVHMTTETHAPYQMPKRMTSHIFTRLSARVQYLM